MPDDELAQTATAPATDGGVADKPAAPLGKTLGRYRLERALGEGGMGVVHAAFDPDLERRVALKVLHEGRAGDDARQRLLREARAMARLTHTNVVTVHEVGSASGRDYVAMELVDGETLAEWLRSQPRKQEEIVDAFVAAGRGLAAAHAAGLVHRDFKPHNVLRRRDGRICVTDFGLARGVEVTAAVSGLEVTMDGANTSTPSSLSGLTRTGSVLGTPAYMAPEQWAGGTVGPAADQFAFCVALWEALTGERPFKGPTIEDLKREVVRGAHLDSSKLPRKLRGALLRGLAASPNDRWPSMDALLASIARAERRPKIAMFVVAGAVVASAAIYVALGRGGPAGGCDPAARDPAQVLSPEIGKLADAAGRHDVVELIAHDGEAWRSTRAGACKEASAKRAPKLACLDAVNARAQAIQMAAVRAGAKGSLDDVLSTLVDPAVCASERPPNLTLAANEDTAAALAYQFEVNAPESHVDAAAVKAFAAKPGLEPCAQSIALGVVANTVKDVPGQRQALDDMITSADACGDDRLRADAMIAWAPLQFEIPTVGPKGRAAVEKVAIAIQRVPAADMLANLDELRAMVAGGEKRWPEAFAATESAIAGYGKRGQRREQVQAAAREIELHFNEGDVAELEKARAQIAKWKPVANELHMKKLANGLDTMDAYSRLFLGDVAGAHADLVRLWEVRKHAPSGGRTVDGVVVDAAGHPVAGAEVAVGSMVWADSVGVFPFGDTSTLQIVTTDANGAFSIANAPMRGPIVATHGAFRAVRASDEHVRLQLAPSRRVAGKAKVAADVRSKSFVMVAPTSADAVPGFQMMAPVAADGTFNLDAAPTTMLSIGIANWDFDRSGSMAFKQLPAGPAPVLDVELESGTSSRTLDVLARSELSTPLDAAQVLIVPGRIQPKTIDDLNAQARTGAHVNEGFAKAVVGESAPQAVLAKFRRGDLLVHFNDVAAGEVTACVIGIIGDVSDPAVWRRIGEHPKEVQLHCETAAASDAVIVVEAPPQKRFD
jgi:serine/threonine protein kinase